MVVDLRNRLQEHLPHLHSQLADEAEQLLFRGFHILHLGGQELVPLADLLVFLDGLHVDAAQGADLILQLRQPPGGPRRVLHRHGHGLRLASGQLIFL